jgi:hypothetical protein
MSNGADDTLSTAMERISMVLGALYASQMGDLEQGLKAERLSRCGYANTEIADLLGMTTNAVNVALHRARQGTTGKKRRK